MSLEELTAVAGAVTTLMGERAAEQPLMARALADLVDLVLLEQLVHICKGDRELAERLHRSRAARARGDS